ncbi:hypothetical protein HYPDE_26743 [Hyphomicrobium denitrificans 1NES1]|uniref:JAB domain-containing protein n=1 Tax=Hyphomicrobium denitrificans 1NES1 TaxID=670307 RepID=N0B0R7_9HYPH|nr:Mov34/MPN/PAD-1 family protein [Hyphomicrobium denitrificans]AGK57029.1 hypothetical protein HYPDE_26743 [Hyphomicrobium denitrificans 1NES1]
MQQLSPSTIRITRAVYDSYRQTIAKHPPETFAILGGRLEDYLVTDFRFCPPVRDASGRYDASALHINVDADLLNWIVDHEWRPNGKFILGVWHSHPPGLTRPSCGDFANTYGDIAFFSACLANDDSPDHNWHTFLAPITTFAADGSDRIHGWTLTRGEVAPRACPVEIIESAATAVVVPARDALAAAELRVVMVRNLLQRYAIEIERVARSRALPRAQRAQMIDALSRMRAAELRDIFAARHPLSAILTPLQSPPHA